MIEIKITDDTLKSVMDTSMSKMDCKSLYFYALTTHKQSSGNDHETDHIELLADCKHMIDDINHIRSVNNEIPYF